MKILKDPEYTRSGTCQLLVASSTVPEFWIQGNATTAIGDSRPALVLVERLTTVIAYTGVVTTAPASAL